MNLLTLLSNIALATIPAIIVAGTCYLGIRAFLNRDHKMRLLEIQSATNKDTRMLRLQAYERLILFLERISPGAVIGRVIEPEMISHELQLAMVMSVRSEFEHNVTQQLYVSSEAWQVVVSAKDEVIKAIAMISAQYPPDTSANQMAKIILESIARSEQILPTHSAIEYLKAEAREMM